MPYTSTFKRPKFSDILKFITKNRPNPPKPSEFEANKYLSQTGVQNTTNTYTKEDEIRYTWLGHASVLVSMSGFNFLCDPVFSSHCSPQYVSYFSRMMGTDRKCALPWNAKDKHTLIDQLPQNLHAVFISHDHYDHLDVETLVALKKRYGEELIYFTFLNYENFLKSYDIHNVVCLNWNDEQLLKMSKKTDKIQVCYEVKSDRHTYKYFKVTGLFCQHWCRRSFFDTNKRLWGSWLVEAVDFKMSFYFAGDTAYDEQFVDALAEKYAGKVDLAAIPIGAYEPRQFMRSMHVNPEEAVRLHKKLGAKQSFGIHWGTFNLAFEHMFAPVDDLEKAKNEHQIENFNAVSMGRTYTFRK